MTELSEGQREGSLEAPTRHPLDWRSPSFYDPAALSAELTRVFEGLLAGGRSLLPL